MFSQPSESSAFRLRREVIIPHGGAQCRLSVSKNWFAETDCTNAAFHAASGTPLIGFPTTQQPTGLLRLPS